MLADPANELDAVIAAQGQVYDRHVRNMRGNGLLSLRRAACLRHQLEFRLSRQQLLQPLTNEGMIVYDDHSGTAIAHASTPCVKHDSKRFYHSRRPQTSRIIRSSAVACAVPQWL